jgi:hypothetical protein
LVKAVPTEVLIMLFMKVLDFEDKCIKYLGDFVAEPFHPRNRNDCGGLKAYFCPGGSKYYK